MTTEPFAPIPIVTDEQRRPRRRWWVVPVVSALAVLLVGTGAAIVTWTLARQDAVTVVSPSPSAPTTSSTTVRGELVLFDSRAGWRESKPCEGSGGYADIHVGTRVVVYDGVGERAILGISELTMGLGVQMVSGPRSGQVGCLFLFAVDGIPVGRGFYQLSIGARDPRSLSEAELDQRLSLALGERI